MLMMFVSSWFSMRPSISWLKASCILRRRAGSLLCTPMPFAEKTNVVLATSGQNCGFASHFDRLRYIGKHNRVTRRRTSPGPFVPFLFTYTDKADFGIERSRLKNSQLKFASVTSSRTKMACNAKTKEQQLHVT